MIKNSIEKTKNSVHQYWVSFRRRTINRVGCLEERTTGWRRELERRRAATAVVAVVVVIVVDIVVVAIEVAVLIVTKIQRQRLRSRQLRRERFSVNFRLVLGRQGQRLRL